MSKKSLIISISFLLIGVGIGISIVYWTNTDTENSTDSTAKDLTVIEDLPQYTGVIDDEVSAINYLRNGNLYSEGKSYKLEIETWFVSKVEYAIYWYDKVISEFPNTPIANRALKDKMITLFGWKSDSGYLYGLEDYKKADSYFPILEKTYAKLETDYPADPHLQAFAFQIAQKYRFYLISTRNSKYITPAKKWMNKTIKYSDGKDTFYSNFAKKLLEIIDTFK